MTQPEPDAQTRAFIDAGESDWAAQAALLEDCVVHEYGDVNAEPIKTPEEWDAEGWDADKLPPKTPEEAAEALNDRVMNPDAPDSPEHVGAYEHLMGGEG